MDKGKWVMPEWFKDYKECFVEFDRVEKLMNDDKTNIVNNAPFYVHIADTRARVSMLMRLKDRGLLK